MKEIDNLDDLLLHYGVKGMKWGVRKDRKPFSRTGQNGNKQSTASRMKSLEKEMSRTKDRKKLKSLQKEYGKLEDSIDYSKPKSESKVAKRVKEEIGSIKRERSWSNKIANLDTMSTKEINKLSNRIQLENDLKRLSKNKNIASKDDKRDYRTREKLSDADLLDKVSRLRAKDNLSRNIQGATRAQTEIGNRVVRTAASVGVSYVLTGKVSTKAIGQAVLSSGNKDVGKNLRNKAVNSILDKTDTTILDTTKKKKV